MRGTPRSHTFLWRERLFTTAGDAPLPELHPMLDGALVLSVAGRNVRGVVAREGDVVWIHALGRIWRLERVDGARRSRAAAGHGARDELLAPMTGTIRRVDVSVGEPVEKGRTLIVLEAMKMEHVLRAPAAGRIAVLDARVGETVDLGRLLVRMELGE